MRTPRLAIAWLACFASPMLAQDLAEEQRLAVIPEGLEASYPRWSPDGQHVGYVGVRDKARFPVFDDEVFDEYTFIEGPFFTPDGAHHAFRIGKPLSKKKEAWWLLLDGKKTKKYDWLSRPYFGPDGERVGFWTQPKATIQSDGAYAQKPHHLVWGKKQGEKWKFKQLKEKWNFANEVLFSEDGQSFFGVVQKHNDWHLYSFDGKREELLSAGYFSVGEACVADKENWAIAVRKLLESGYAEDRTRIVHNGEELGEAFETVGDPRLSSGGRHLAYLFEKGGKLGVVLDEKIVVPAKWDFISFLGFSPDGQRLVCVANEGGKAKYESPHAISVHHSWISGGREQVLVLPGSSGPPPEGLNIEDVTWDASGSQFAYRLQEGDKWRVVAGDVRSEPFDVVGLPRFSADGRRVGFGARIDRELWWKVLSLVP